MNISPVLLNNLCSDLQNNTLWGLARLNEYAESNPVLHSVILKKMNRKISEQAMSSRLEKKLFKKLLSGSTLSDLSSTEVELIKLVSLNKSNYKQKEFCFNKQYSKRTTLKNLSLVNER